MTVTDISSVAVTAAFLSQIIIFRGISEEAAYIKYAKCCLSFSESPTVLEIVLSSNYWLGAILVQDNVNIKEPGFLINQLRVSEIFL